MQFIIRTDDIGWNGDKQPDRDLAIARRFHDAMGGLPYLAAIIPACLDSAGAGWLAANPAGLLVALHGWNHAPRLGVHSEFHGLGLEHCRSRLSRGRRILREQCGIECEHLVLPFNGFEPELPEACSLEGIRYIWGGGSHDRAAPSEWPTPPQPYSIGRAIFVPSWAPTYSSTLWSMQAEQRPLCETLPPLMELPGKAVLTLHITWEIAKCDDFRGVKWLAGLLRGRVISQEEYLR